MKLIKPGYEIIPQEKGMKGVLKQCELAGRIAYKSEDKITEDSANTFVNGIIKANHGAVLEHGTIYLHLTINSPEKDYEYLEKFNIVSFYFKNKYSVVNKVQDKYNDMINHYYITTNYRVIIENNKEDDLSFMCEPTEFHEKRITVKFITDTGCVREILRHRKFSFLNESTRYCNYSHDRLGKELTFIAPHWFESTSHHLLDGSVEEMSYKSYLCQCERLYMNMIEKYKPQDVRGILPLCTKSELIATAFTSDWKHFFDLRTDIAKTGKPHPDLLQITNPLYNDFINLKFI